jgi:hypothetical protein
VEGTCSFSLHQGSNLIVYVCHPAVLYMLTMFARYLVGPGISCGARKLIQTPWVTQKKKRNLVVLLPPSQLYLVCSSSLRSASSAILVYWNTLKVTIFFFYQHLILQCIKYISFLVLDNLFLSFPSCFMVKSNTYASAFRKFILLVIF